MRFLGNVSQDLAQSLLKPINPSLVILLGLYTILWGLWVGNPLWTVFSQASLYEKMASLAPEVVWGAVAVTCGCFTTYGVLRPSHRTLVAGALIAAWHWSMISIFYFWGDWQNTGGITSAVFGVYALTVAMNLRVNKHRFNWSEEQGNRMLKRQRNVRFW